MADDNVIRKAIDPMSDSSGGWGAPELDVGLTFRDFGSYGLRQFGGWVRDEILEELTGRNAARTYREMRDNDAVIGGMLFAIHQSFRRVSWRIDPANDTAEAEQAANFVESLRSDMSHTWDEFVAEALTMLEYGFSVHEIVYKRRLGQDPPIDPQSKTGEPLARSEFNDGLIGWRRLPVRGQDITLKWFFDANGQVKGMTQQPWVGTLIDIPIEKMLLFRPLAHKNNPEGRSILRNAYRSYYFVKRIEEMEAILVERMSGLPVLYLPSELLEAASAPNPPAGSPQNPLRAQAIAAINTYKNIVTNTRVNEQMGVVLPSNPYIDAEGKPSSVRQFEFKLETPARGRSSGETDKIIMRHQVRMLMSLLCDFLMMGHEVRGTNNLSITRVDMFYAAIEGWLNAVADVINRYAIPRLWRINSFERGLMPRLMPDMPQRLDLDSLGAFIKNVAAAGMPLFPNDELEAWIYDAAGMPEIDLPGTKPEPTEIESGKEPKGSVAGAPDLEKALLGRLARHMMQLRAQAA